MNMHKTAGSSRAVTLRHQWAATRYAAAFSRLRHRAKDIS
jgi:hypothetical protein